MFTHSYVMHHSRCQCIIGTILWLFYCLSDKTVEAGNLMAHTLKSLFKDVAFSTAAANTVLALSLSGAQPAGADIYEVDNDRKDPGYVYRLNTATGDHDPVFWLPKGTINSIAFNVKTLYFVDGGS